MRITIRKRLLAILMAAVLLASAAVGVNATYVDMLDYGLAYSNPNARTLNYNLGAGDSFYTYGRLFPYWALDSFDPDYTYTFTFSFTSESNINPSSQYVYLSNVKITEIANLTSSKVYLGITKDQIESGYKYEVIVKLNPGVLGLDYFPLYVYASFMFGARTMSTNNWGVSAEYDPGGSQFIEDYLADIRDQLHAGDDKLDNIPSNSDFSNSVSSIDSAEASLISASDPNGTALSDFSAKGKTTVTAVNTTYRQTFAFINSLVTKVMDDLDFGALVFLALTLGLIAYILGRIK